MIDGETMETVTDYFLGLQNHCRGWLWKSLSHVQLFAAPWTIWSMEFSRPEYGSGQPFPSPGHLPNPGIEARFPALQVDYLPGEPPGKPMVAAAMKLRHLLLGRKAMTNLHSILKSIGTTLPTKVHLVKAMVFPIVMYGCESWTIKKAEHRSTDAFELWCWRRLLRVTWIARRSNKLILKEISPDHSLQGLMLKLQYFGHLMGRTDSLEKTLILGKIQGRRRRGQQDETVGWHHWLERHEFEQAPGVGDRQRSLVCCNPWGHKESDMTERLKWTDWIIQNKCIDGGITKVQHIKNSNEKWL